MVDGGWRMVELGKTIGAAKLNSGQMSTLKVPRRHSRSWPKEESARARRIAMRKEALRAPMAACIEKKKVGSKVTPRRFGFFVHP